jgi:hypothetical protein
VSFVLARTTHPRVHTVYISNINHYTVARYARDRLRACHVPSRAIAHTGVGVLPELVSLTVLGKSN